jgi:gamma-glutamylcyclotransferase
VLYQIDRSAAVKLDASEGVPGRRYRPLWLAAEDVGGDRIAPTLTYIPEGKPTDGKPSLRYLTLLRDGARAHDLPQPWLAFLE